VRKLAFVAPKADLVHPSDRDQLESLLRRLAERPAADRDGLRSAFINCCAAVSTRPLPGTEHTLLGRPMRGPDGRKLAPGDEQKFTVSALPRDWPRHWSANEFVFPEVWPSVPARKNCPPDQINLDRLLAFILE
jgi:predicted YcjX-like family ATPase